MAQRDKIKELVGRGLGSYHTKALQQIDRIEKKNKEQNHKISILTNKLDNDYLTKTEEGSVISLEHSKEGMVYLDELQGNTLVNYCVDGVKELTLNDEINVEGTSIVLDNTIDNGLVDISLEGNTLVNVCTQEEPMAITKTYAVENTNHISLQGEYDGKCKPVIYGNTMVNYCVDGIKELTLNNEINVQGTNVTLTDTVDNGKVDVVCKGNTLVNLATSENFIVQRMTMNGCKFTRTSFNGYGYLDIPLEKLSLFKSNGRYKVIVNITKNTLQEEGGTQPAFQMFSYYYSGHAIESSTHGNYSLQFQAGEVGIKECIITMKDFDNPSNPISKGVINFSSSFYATSGELEGYVIICEYNENTQYPTLPFEGMKSAFELEDNKVEIVGQGKNLSPINTTIPKKWSGSILNHKLVDISLKPNTSYVISNSYDGEKGDMRLKIFNLSTNNLISEVWGNGSHSFTTNNDTLYYIMAYDFGAGIPIKNIQLEEGTEVTSYVPYATNTHSIQLSEPLRGLPNGIKDKFVKIGNRWYVERNCKFELLTENTAFTHYYETPTYIGFRLNYGIGVEVPNGDSSDNILSDKLKSIRTPFGAVMEGYGEGVCYYYENTSSNGVILIVNKSNLETLDVEGLQKWLSTNNIKVVYPTKPTYEEIADLTLSTYLDTTHISNNSLIPCNMKVKNTGYNAILKPSTQYTVALDSDINEAVGITLGGAKTNITNNIATITTPSTLTDDSLIIHGKGIKVSNAMIFEGDLTQTPRLVPDKYVEGLKSSFEDKCIPSNLIDYSEVYGLNNNNKIPVVIDNNKLSYTTNWNQLIFQVDIPVKSNTTYTFFVQYDSSEGYDSEALGKVEMRNNGVWTANTQYSLTHFGTDMCMVKHTTLEDTETLSILINTYGDGTFKERSLTIKNLMLLEGDYSSNSYTYDEVTNHTGKYKVEYKVTGKNKFNIDKLPNYLGGTLTNGVYNTTGASTSRIMPLNIKAPCTISLTVNEPTTVGSSTFSFIHSDGTCSYQATVVGSNTKITRSFSKDIVGFRLDLWAGNVKISNFQIEEGEVATTYEQYKEYTKVFYLNSPLLKGDTIEDVNGKATHVHRWIESEVTPSNGFYLSTTNNSDYCYVQIGKNEISNPFDVAAANGSGLMCEKYKSVENAKLHSVEYANSIGITSDGYIRLIFPISTVPDLVYDGSNWYSTVKPAIENWLEENPIKIIYKLASPIYETISEESILCDSYVNGHLDFDTNISINRANFGQAHSDRLLYLNANTDYILQFEADNNGIIYGWNVFNTYFGSFNVTKGINRIPFTTGIDAPTPPDAFLSMNINGIGFNMSNIQVVATDQNFGYFKGMYSVGQDDEGNHKIEIISQNKNLFNYEEYYRYFPSTKTSDSTILSHKGDLKGGHHGFNFASPMKVNLKSNTTYTFCVFNLSDSGQVLSCEGCLSSKGNELSMNIPIGEIGYKVFTTNSTNYKDGISFKFNTSTDGENAKYKIMLVEGDVRPTNYIHFTQNKKEVLLNEPLRGFEDGKKDRIVKIGTKWFIERNCILLNYADFNWSVSQTEDDYLRAYSEIPQKLNSPITKCNTLLSINEQQAIGFTPLKNCVWVWNTPSDKNYVYVSIEKSKLTALTNNGLKQWFTDNPTYVLCQLATSTYEELLIDPILNTYTDVTHISNNSTIPCNMKIQNSGYNAIIKPSTLYTVALDSNKSGTIGINLGGAKVTTTNNVATITTPATLTDDDLVLYGKGIKTSNIRLLEGDKTNYIPSYFEGMQSSFEDKLQGDGTYKMEILSNNKNLFNENKLVDVGGKKYYWGGIKYWYELHLKPNTTYNISAVKNKEVSDTMGYTYFADTHFKTCKYVIRANSDMGKQGSMTLTTGLDGIILLGKYASFITEYANVLITESNSSSYIDFISNKSNSIQLSSIEPLRSVGTIKDRFVFKDGKLMIERNTKEILLNGSEDWRYREARVDGYCYTLNIPDLKKYGTNNYKQGYVDRFFMRNLLPFGAFFEYLNGRDICLQLPLALGNSNVNAIKDWLNVNNTRVVYELEQPIYEEIPFELQKIIFEGYENGTLFFDTNIPPTPTVTYAGETPIVKSVKSSKTEVVNNTNDINDNIVPYLMDMDYRVVCLQLEGGIENISMARLFGGTYEMLQRDILSERYSKEEYLYRLDTYLSANKITEDEYEKLGGMLNE